ncbi:hypothetical protein [Piscinibacter defluvii]|uniref:hypothetical protein n=1 Tax=Piscinibacter defluvii TaxID=1796922 RepID=UPI000FDE5E67|nr:hypothetical protein [Piscinibacter defluvii]
MSLPLDPFGRSQLPDALASELCRERARAERKERVRDIARAAEAMLTSGDPAQVFVGSALASWLADGGDLVRVHLKVAAPRSSRATPAVLWAELQQEAHPDEDRRRLGAPQSRPSELRTSR